jgi:hypothetical protein
MAVASTKDVVRNAVQQLSRPFETANDVKAVAITLDSIAADLLKSSDVTIRLGADRASELTAVGAELPVVFDAVGDEGFGQAAESARELLAVSGSSLVEFGSAQEELTEANIARARLHDALAKLLGAIGE